MGHSRFDLNAMIHLLEDQKNAWSEIANALENLTQDDVPETTRQKLAARIFECRGRAEAIRRTVARMADPSLTAGAK
jgi:hypothetical protein